MNEGNTHSFGNLMPSDWTSSNKNSPPRQTLYLDPSQSNSLNEEYVSQDFGRKPEEDIATEEPAPLRAETYSLQMSSLLQAMCLELPCQSL